MSQPSLETLKAAAYDHLAQIEQLQRRLQQINQAIANFKPVPDPKEPEQTVLKKEEPCKPETKPADEIAPEPIPAEKPF